MEGTNNNFSTAYRIVCLLLSGRSHLVEWNQLSDAEWQGIVDVALLEGVAPLVYCSLRAANQSDHIPSSFGAALQREYYNTAANNALMFKELDRILTKFDQANIKTIVVKGADLSSNLYTDPGVRPMGDLDLLIPEGQLKTASQIVTDLGFILDDKLLELSPKLLERIGTELNYGGGESIPVHLEIHWNLVRGRDSKYYADPHWFFKETRSWDSSVGFGKSNVFVLTPSAHLLYLIAHLALKHYREASLRWLYDIHLIIYKHQGEIDWDELLQQARQYQWQDALAPVLGTIKKYFDTPFPTDLFEQIPESSLQITSKRIQDPSPWKDTLAEMQELKWSTRLWVILTLIFPYPKYIRCKYKPRPKWIWPVFYLYRWWDIGKSILIETLLSAKKKAAGDEIA